MDIILLVGVALLFIIGIIGIFVPVIPSLPIIWIGIALYAIATHFEEVTVSVVLVTGVLMIIGSTLEITASILGAKLYGASWIGVCGAVIGMIVGFIFLNMIGMIIGSFVGTFIGEYIQYKKTHSAIKASMGTIVGFIFGVIINIFISFLMIVIFGFALF